MELALSTEMLVVCKQNNLMQAHVDLIQKCGRLTANGLFILINFVHGRQPVLFQTKNAGILQVLNSAFLQPIEIQPSDCPCQSRQTSEHCPPPAASWLRLPYDHLKTKESCRATCEFIWIYFGSLKVALSDPIHLEFGSMLGAFTTY